MVTKFATRFGAIALACVACVPAHAAMLDLSRYNVALTTDLGVGEASAITYNWDQDSLFVVGDETGAGQFTKTGVRLPTEDLLGNGLGDTEGVTYVGGGKYVIADERTMDMSLIGVRNTVDQGGGVTRIFYTDQFNFDTGELIAPTYSLSGGVNVGNVGLEGISYDPITGNYFAVKENSPQGVFMVDPNFDDVSLGSHTALFDPALLGLITISDIQVLSTVPGFSGRGFEENLLILSQSSQKLLEVTRTGEVLSSFDLSGITGPGGFNIRTVEGVTIDFDGNIYLAAELGGGTSGNSSALIVLSAPAVPEPATWAMMIGGFAMVGGAIRRRNRTKLALA